MTITEADYRLSGTSEDNRLGPFIRLTDLFVCFNSMQIFFFYCVMWHRMSFNPQNSRTCLLCAECINIHSLLIFIKAISEVQENVGQTWVLSSRDALSGLPFWSAASNGRFRRFLLSRWICESLWLLGIYFLALSPGTKHIAPSPFPKM